ncbi:MAG TPA: FtsX-like permease family protein [Oscillatoriaceae cyanobacterium M33_DOE_052]|uniref:FtsX-like permease family protein n=1 Tax=Planktothricoides sp. SpSt-374 TaxID=2282167 RepID=A0A7C3VE73_9CYAN|nr:FtsX-like permease family protein [Oscillatoriaceae cyanobacterium M33_DOE_052]
MFDKIPLAWLQLTREKIRLVVAVAGITFADTLMFMQLGFQDALFDSSTRMHQNLNGDLVLISPKSEALIAMQTFSWRRLYQTLAVPGVESVNPLYMGLIGWKNPETKRDRQILVVGFDPKQSVFTMPEVEASIPKIKLPDVVIFDRSARPEFGPVAPQIEAGKTVTTEVGGRRVYVKGLFSLGASFAADGNIITSDLNFLRIFNRRKKGEIDAGIIYLKPGADREKVLADIKALLPDDVKVLTREGFIEFEKTYWRESTAIGFIFGLGVAMGFIVGIVIVYQIIYTDVADHLSEYATLKAMGYKNAYFYLVVFQEAFLLAILGYLPGVPIVMVLYNLTKNATMLPVAMTASRALTVLILTIVMCFISGSIAVRKLQEADPADIF